MAEVGTDRTATLAEQKDYYRARAAEYDEWFLRQGRYDHGPELDARWHGEVAQVRAALTAAALTGEVLELACGTGLWTELLAATATRVAALDAAPEMIAINRARLDAAGLTERVTFAEADLFAWQPDRAYDAVFFGFWLSHVPDDRLDPFLAAVAAATRPGGTVFWVDSQRQDSGTAPDQPLPAAGEELTTRRLNDGRTYRIVKRFRGPAELVAAFRRAGVDLSVTETPTYFQLGRGTRR